MAYVQQVDPDDAKGILKDEYERGKLRAGKVYNILRVQSLTPVALDAVMVFYNNVMHGKGPLRKWERELLAAVVSKINGCVY
jgi:alkylhydroperoxidase family enzyme